MALTEQGVIGGNIAALVEQTVALSDEMAGGLDSEGNLWLADGDSIYFGADKDFSIGPNAAQTSLLFKDLLGQTTLMELNNDGSMTLQALNSAQIGSWTGNVALASDGFYVRTND